MDETQSLLENLPTINGPLDLLQPILISFLLGIIIASVYKKTAKTLTYSQTFTTTLALLLPLVTLIILFISNSIPRAVGVFGAFSIVRFRTAIKDSRDMLFIFWILATALIIGTGQSLSAFLVTILVSVMIYFLIKINFGKLFNYDYLLTYLLDTKTAKISEISDIINKFTKEQSIINIQVSKDSKESEVSTSIVLKKKGKIEELINELKKNKAIIFVNMNPSISYQEY